MAGRRRASNRRRRKRKLIVFIIEIIILALVLGVLFLYSKLEKIDYEELDTTQVEVNELTDETVETLSGYTTIALFALDNRDTGTYTNGNSDVIMVMAINNDTKEVSLVSIYRDTYLDVSASGESWKFRKANAAYAYGGAEQAISMLNRNLDLDIDNYVTVDFAAVAEAIDILGGVEIEIESSAELGYLNDYIVATNKILGTSSSTISTVGTHTLDGVQAVAYCRIRYTSGNDYKRAERQRRVIAAMVEQAKQASLSQISELVNTVFPDIQTDLTKAEILSMVSVLLGYDLSSSGGFPYDKTTYTPSSSIGDVVVACDLESNVIELHEQLYGTEDYEPSETVLQYSSYIINSTGITADSAVDDEFSDEDDFTGDGTEEEDDTDDESEDDAS